MSEDTVIGTLSARVASMETELLQIRYAMQGSMGGEGLISRVEGLKSRQEELRGLLRAVQEQQRLDTAAQTQRDQEQQKKDKRTNQYFVSLLGLVTTVIGAILVELFTGGMMH
jgi:C4-type Zn-finger protein